MSVLLKTLASSLQGLNADLGVQDDGVVLSNCGTFALIDRAINDLAAVRTQLKAAEKQVEKVLVTTMLTAPGAELNAAVALNATLDAQTLVFIADEAVSATSEVLRETGAALLTDTKSTDTQLNSARGGTDTTAQNVGFKIGKATDGTAAGQAFTEAHLVNVLADIYKRIRSLLQGTVAVAGVATSKD